MLESSVKKGNNAPLRTQGAQGKVIGWEALNRGRKT